MKTFPPFLVALAAALLAGCGGGAPAVPTSPVAVRPVSLAPAKGAVADARRSNQGAAEEVARALRLLGYAK